MKTILIADCDKVFCSKLDEYLKNYGKNISLLTACNPIEAIETLKASNIDLLVADINMQPAEGADLLAFVKSNYKDMPVYVTMEHMDMKTYKKLNALGVSDYIIKPYDLQNLLTNINYLLADDKPGQDAARVRS